MFSQKQDGAKGRNQAWPHFYRDFLRGPQNILVHLIIQNFPKISHSEQGKLRNVVYNRVPYAPNSRLQKRKGRMDVREDKQQCIHILLPLKPPERGLPLICFDSRAFPTRGNGLWAVGESLGPTVHFLLRLPLTSMSNWSFQSCNTPTCGTLSQLTLHAAGSERLSVQQSPSHLLAAWLPPVSVYPSFSSHYWKPHTPTFHKQYTWPTREGSQHTVCSRVPTAVKNPPSCLRCHCVQGQKPDFLRSLILFLIAPHLHIQWRIDLEGHFKIFCPRR